MLQTSKPAVCIGHKCGLDRPDAVVVNLNTQNIVTCQNTLPVGRHLLGHVSDLPGPVLNTVWHWRSRDNCIKCPVLAFCRGGCLYLENDEFSKACLFQFYYRLPFLCAAVFFITGLIPIRLVSWMGDIDLSSMTQSCRENLEKGN